MQRHFLIIDGNSIGHMAQNMKPLSLGTMQVQAIYGFLRILRSHAAKYAFATPIVLWDGLSWRKTAYPAYKENRDRAVTKHEIAKQASNKAYHAQRPHIEKALSFLGVAQVKAQNMEADDLAAILVNLYRGQGCRVTLLTEDQDWLQLVQDGVAVERPRSKDRVTVMNFTEITGCKDARTFVEMKALMGDGGDNIKGVGNVGDKRALEFLETYGSFNNFLNMVTLEKSIDLKTLPKWQRDLVEDEAKAIAFDFNIKLVDLNTSARPKPVGWHVFKGEPSAENFRKMCDLLLFKSITDQFEDWISTFSAHAPAAAQHAA
jgi:5'-3' exonuclease